MWRRGESAGKHVDGKLQRRNFKRQNTQARNRESWFRVWEEDLFGSSLKTTIYRATDINLQGYEILEKKKKCLLNQGTLKYAKEETTTERQYECYPCSDMIITYQAKIEIDSWLSLKFQLSKLIYNRWEITVWKKYGKNWASKQL